MSESDIIVCDPKPMRFSQRFYLIEVVKGLGVTLRHFLGNLFRRKYTVTVEWPEVKREYSDRLRGKHVIVTREDGSPLVWIHAVSVGEAAAAAIFTDAFLERNPGYKVVVSTITDTGRRVATDKLRGKAEVIYLPFDLPLFLHRAISALRPSVFLVMGTEIWPNLFFCLKDSGVPLALLNGRISEKSFRSYNRLQLWE